jgi:hypothetical protein
MFSGGPEGRALFESSRIITHQNDIGGSDCPSTVASGGFRRGISETPTPTAPIKPWTTMQAKTFSGIAYGTFSPSVV